MRAHIYKTIINEANKLPRDLTKDDEYGKAVFNYHPRNEAIFSILKRARYDEHLFHSEFVEIYNYSKEK